MRPRTAARPPRPHPQPRPLARSQAQRVGPVTIDDNFEDDDLTVIMVPSEAVGFVTGSGGNFLRQVEEEWCTLMFFADFRGRSERNEVRPRRRRRRTARRRRPHAERCRRSG